MGYEKEERYVKSMLKVLGGKPENFEGITPTKTNGIAGLAVPNTLLGRRFPSLVKSKILINPSKYNKLSPKEKLSVLRHEAAHTIYPRHDDKFEKLSIRFRFQKSSGQ